MLRELCFQISHFLLTALLPGGNSWKQSRFLDSAHGVVAAVGSKLGIKMTSSSKESDNPDGEILGQIRQEISAASQTGVQKNILHVIFCKVLLWGHL